MDIHGTPDDSTTPPIILLGNKVDVDGGSSRVVSDEKARAWCASRGNIPYFETSAKMDFNLDAAFLSIAMSVLAKERDDVSKC
ncbi:putative small GTPase superfamily, P-loop containing nucleoside triphosphate hydrolase [Medicago truncatula]|uniref:Putative small GTPase superfamily, P-loop containing nucleoside triphosphate hydrolase n=1 Tax=Medicago truncatula TaxID=3880 RepID=A0A396HCY8_MEDTR|nr:putative small GTPase superfamily, P-loop containing nucleoside triphosphate hydrolase [Medicago truncatula]